MKRVLCLLLILAGCGKAHNGPSPSDGHKVPQKPSGGHELCQKGQDCWVFLQDLTVADWETYLNVLSKKECPPGVTALDGQALAGAHIMLALEKTGRVPEYPSDREWQAVANLYDLTFQSSCYLREVTADELSRKVAKKYKFKP